MIYRWATIHMGSNIFWLRFQWSLHTLEFSNSEEKILAVDKVRQGLA